MPDETTNELVSAASEKEKNMGDTVKNIGMNLVRRDMYNERSESAKKKQAEEERNQNKDPEQYKDTPEMDQSQQRGESIAEDRVGNDQSKGVSLVDENQSLEPISKEPEQEQNLTEENAPRDQVEDVPERPDQGISEMAREDLDAPERSVPSRFEATEQKFNSLSETKPEAYDNLVNSTGDDISESLRTMRENYELMQKEYEEAGIIKDGDRPVSEQLEEFLKEHDVPQEGKEALEFSRDFAKDVETSFDGIDKAMDGQSVEEQRQGIEEFNFGKDDFKDKASALNEVDEERIDELEELFQERDINSSMPSREGRAFENTQGKDIGKNLGKGVENLASQGKNLQQGEQNTKMAVETTRTAHQMKEALEKAGRAAKKIAKKGTEFWVKTGMRTAVGTAACSNPWTAAVYIAVQIAIRTAKFAISKSKMNEHTASKALSGGKDAGSQNGVRKADSKRLEKEDAAIGAR